MSNAGFVALSRSIGRGIAFLSRAGGWRIGALGLTASLVVVQLLVIAWAGVGTAGDMVLERSAVHLDIEPGASDARVQELYAEAGALPSIKDVAFVPREQVLADERSRDASLDEFLDRYGLENPFSDTLAVVPAHAGAFAELRDFVRDADGFDATALQEIAAQEAGAAHVLAAVDMARAGVKLLLVLAAVTAAFLSIDLLTRLAAGHRDAMRDAALAGASQTVVSLPLASAGAVTLVGSLILATILAAALTGALSFFASSAAVSAWLTASVLGFLLWLPVVLFAEGALLVLAAAIAGRASSPVGS